MNTEYIKELPGESVHRFKQVCISLPKFISLVCAVLFLLVFNATAPVAMAQGNVWLRTGGPIGGLGYANLIE